MSLRAIQSAFADALYADATSTLAALVRGPQRGTAADGIGVYRNNTRQRLKSVLAETFPVCRQLVGERCFEQLAQSHVDAYPCRTHDLDTYGGEFSQTINRVLDQQQDFQLAVPYLADMASIEWCLHRAYFAADRSPFDYEAFAALAEPGAVRFQLQPDLAALELDWPVAPVWEMHQPGQGVVERRLVPGRHYYAVERPRFQPRVEPIDAALYRVLCRIQSGDSLDRLATLPNGSELLSRVFQDNWIANYVAEAADNDRRSETY